MADDMGFSDIGCYGSEINTPVLDKLANGLRFTCFTTHAVAARASLLTGMYQHQAGIGLMTGDNKLPGYRGELGRDVVTIAEALGAGGYRRYMSGKWHVTKNAASGSDNWPLQRGFEKFYGTIIGAGSFDPATLCRRQFIAVNDEKYQPKTYYYTDAISDNAVTFCRSTRRSRRTSRCFSMCPTPAHWRAYLAGRYRALQGVYDGGFQKIQPRGLHG